MNYFILILFFILSIIFPVSTFSNDELISNLQSGGNIVFIRHAIAPGSGDPNNIDLNDCRTQRNLSEEGINQSKKIGELFIENNIPIDKVLSSEWCRCKDTARYAFKNYKTFHGLNSFYDEKFYKFKEKQILDLKTYINNWDSEKNLILITHYVVIYELLNLAVSSGELIVTKKNLELIGRIKTK